MVRPLSPTPLLEVGPLRKELFLRLSKGLHRGVEPGTDPLLQVLLNEAALYRSTLNLTKSGSRGPKF